MAITNAAPVPPRRPNLFQRIATHRADYLYVLPALGVMALVIAYPIYYTIYLSFFKTSPSLAMSDITFTGFDNYAAVLKSDSFREVTINTVIWTVFSTAIAFVLGFGAALALNREFLGRGILRALLLIPYVISAVAAAYVWRWIYHSDYGVIGALATSLHLTSGPINFLDNTHTVLAALIVVNVWKEFSFAMIMMLAGLQTVPDQLHRAAMIDGAGPWDRFWHVTMPHLKGVTLITVLLMVVANLNSFTIPWIMTGGGPAGASDLWITQVYQIAFGRVRFGTASAYSVILFIIMMVLGYFYIRASAARMRARAMSATGITGRVDGWRWTGRIFITLLTLFSVLPMVWMVITSIKTQYAALQYPPEWWPGEPTFAQYVTLLDPTSEVGREFLTYL